MFRKSGPVLWRVGPEMQMSMNSAERGLPLSTGRNADTRSPFVRLAELIADVKPGKPVVDLGVGEPKHPVPDFVAPVIAAHIKDFGRYPRNEGTLQFRRAAAETGTGVAFGVADRPKRPCNSPSSTLTQSTSRPRAPSRSPASSDS